MSGGGMRLPWLLIAVAGLARLLPHAANFAPVGGLGLYAGARLPARVAWAVPLLAMLGGDAMRGGYSAVVLLAVYLGLLGGPLAGRWLAAGTARPRRFALAALAGAAWFFLVSNLGMWWSGIGVFPLTAAGLLDCYLAGLPFLGRTLAADALFAGLLFGLEALARRTQTGVPRRQPAG